MSVRSWLPPFESLHESPAWTTTFGAHSSDLPAATASETHVDRSSSSDVSTLANLVPVASPSETHADGPSSNPVSEVPNPRQQGRQHLVSIDFLCYILAGQVCVYVLYVDCC